MNPCSFGQGLLEKSWQESEGGREPQVLSSSAVCPEQGGNFEISSAQCIEFWTYVEGGESLTSLGLCAAVGAL